MKQFDVVIVGAGIAGASLAAEIAGKASVLILEAEAQPGYHATGRSAAFWEETYGGPYVQPLTSASGDWLRAPPLEFHDASFLSLRGMVLMAGDQELPLLDEFEAEFEDSGVQMRRIGRDRLLAHCDGLKPGWQYGIEQESCADIDVAALHQAYLRASGKSGVELRCNASLVAAERGDGRWRIETTAGTVFADILVDASGAWADEVAARSGVAPIGISPFRRTMVQLRFDHAVPRALPLMMSARGDFYFKADGAGGVWLSPHDEIPSPATDAAPEEIDVAIAIDRFEQAVDWRIAQVTHKWAGLRSFSPDRLPVYGFDARTPAFFWFAGQGGFGIQTAPAAAKIGANLLLGQTADPMVEQIDTERYAPGRFT